MPGLYDTFDTTTGFWVVNVFEIFTMLGCIMGLQNFSGKKNTKDGDKAFCEGHYYGYGPELGVREGDHFDAYTQFFIVPCKLMAWVPVGICQVYAVMGDIYWSLMLFGILGNFLMSVPVDKNVKAGPSVGWLLFQLGTLPLLNCIFRLAYYTLPNIPSDQTDAFVAMFAAWYFVCTIHPAILATRAYSFKADPTFKYMTDLATAHGNYLSETTSAPKAKEAYGATDLTDVTKDASKLASAVGERVWPMDAIHPTGFDVLNDGPINLLTELRDATSKPLETPEQIDEHIETWMDENTYPKSIWFSCMVIGFALMFLLPVIVDAAH